MSNQFQQFNKLHQQAEPLLIGNAWNVQSAKIFEQKNYKAIATSSAAVAETLGYDDGQEMSFDEYLFVIKRLAASVSIPFSVDMEAGYGSTAMEICKNILALYELGVSGINIEDSIITDGKRSIVKAEAFAEKLGQIISLLNAGNIKMFINVRSDSFLLGLPNALDDAFSRINLYQDTGVHGLFFPCITNIEDIRKVTENSKLPINVMCMPGLPDFKQLKEAGVKRISMGGFLNKKTYQLLQIELETILKNQSFDNVF